MSETMNAMVLTGHGGPEKLAWREDWPKPKPGPGEALIRVAACGVNNTDINTRVGWYSKSVTAGTEASGDSLTGDTKPSWGGTPISFPRIQGADVCGYVEVVGSRADASLIGRRVLVDTWLRDPADPMNMSKAGYLGSEVDGGFAEFVKIDAANVHPIDCHLSDSELATFACSYSTAEGMLSRANVGAGDRVLVTGASGGVGSALMQLAKRRGATVIALASESKHDLLRPFGPDALLPREPADLRHALKEATGEDDVTVVADIVGGPYWPNLIDALAPRGRYTASGAIAGPMVTLDLRTFYLRDLTFTGSTLIAPNVFSDLVGYIERGEIRPILAGTYPLRELHAAQDAFTGKTHVGNIVVIP